MLKTSISIEKRDNMPSREEIMAKQKHNKCPNKRSDINERYIRDYLLTSARLCAACLIILDKKRSFKQACEKDMATFRSTLKEYLSLINEILREERETYTYIIRDDAYMVMTMYRAAYLVRKTCRCKANWYGRTVYLGYFKDYDFGINGISGQRLFTGFEQMLLKSLKIDPRSIYKLASIRTVLSGNSTIKRH